MESDTILHWEMSSSDGCVSLPVCLSVTSHYSKFNLLKNCTTYHYLPKWQHRASLVTEMVSGLFRELFLCNSFSVSVFCFLCAQAHPTQVPFSDRAAEDSEHVAGLALPALLLCAPLLNTLFPLLPLGMVSSIWREKGKRAVFKANHKLKKMEWNRPSSSMPISPQAPVESRFASEILNCIVFQKLQRSSLLWGSLLLLLVEELERSETSGHGPVWCAQHPGVWAEQLWVCAGCRCLRLSLLTDKKYQWRCHFSSAGNFVT